MTTVDWDGVVWSLSWLARGLGNEGGCTGDVEGGDTEELVAVKDTSLLQDLGGDWDGGVDWVGDDLDRGLWCVLSDGLDEVSDDGCVGVEEVVSGHAWLSWDTSWDDNNLSALEALANLLWVETLDLGSRWDVGQVSGDTWSTLQVEEAELGDVVVELAEQRQWLSDTAVCTVCVSYRRWRRDAHSPEDGDVSVGSSRV